MILISVTLPAYNSSILFFTLLVGKAYYHDYSLLINATNCRIGIKWISMWNMAKPFYLRIHSIPHVNLHFSPFLGCDYVIANSGSRDVASMSLGGGASVSMDNAVNDLVNAGVATAVAAGNEDQDACNVSPSRASSVWHLFNLLC